MIYLAEPFRAFLASGGTPLIYVVIVSPMCSRIFCMNGDYYGATYISSPARLLGFSELERTYMSDTRSWSAGIQARQTEHISVVLDNSDNEITKILSQEPLLGCEIRVVIGDAWDTIDNHIALWRGLISEIIITSSTVHIEAESI